ncbi:arylesterase [Acephala macrosclerotiorum]|nr:arylesterase [Acephala macrosclerotiorum]
MASKPSIVLVHGLWMTPLCWEDWITHFKAAGYTTVLAPGWPGIDSRTPEDIRLDPSALADLTIRQIVDHYASIIEDLPTPPIIMGHSFGGLFTQILLSRGLGAAGVGISPGQPSGVIALKPSTIKAGFGVLGHPSTYKAAVPITESQFHYAFGNHLSKAESKVLWEKYSIPSAAHILWQGLEGAFTSTGNAKSDGHVDFAKKDRAPLLIIGGTKDHVVPVEVVEAEMKHYKGPAVVEMKIFEGRSHGIVNQDGWEEVADFALKWVEEHIAK